MSKAKENPYLRFVRRIDELDRQNRRLLAVIEDGLCNFTGQPCGNCERCNYVLKVLKEVNKAKIGGSDGKNN